MNSALQFSISPYTPFMQETKVNLGNGIELHVEVGGKPEHPTDYGFRCPNAILAIKVNV
ncbi:alpha/beta hydrolase fold EstB domain protein [Acinetobacter baumannii 24812_8]|nr:alpha/beta hydrolase fold EstB domain protein [Acinetobacter baumannii 24812_8]